MFTINIIRRGYSGGNNQCAAPTDGDTRRSATEKEFDSTETTSTFIQQDLSRDPFPASDTLTRKPVEIQIVEYFVGENLNYYPEGIPLMVIKLLNGLHKNPWVRVDQGDVLIAKAFVALWVAWLMRVIAGVIDPLQPVSEADLVRLTGLTKDTVRNALRFGEYGGFLSLYKKSLNRGKESHQNTRGKPPQYYVFCPLGEAWSTFMAKMEPLMWRALLIEKYPDLPVEAVAIDDLLCGGFNATPDEVAVIDELSQPLYDQHTDDLFAVSQHLYWRVDKWRNEYICPADLPPLRLPEGVTFENAAQFGDLLNELDMIAHKGERKDEDRYHIQDLTGRTDATHLASNKRVGIASVPQFRYYPVKPDVDLVTQCQNTDQVAFERVRIKVCAPNGKGMIVSPGRARTFDYDAWLVNNGGRQGAFLQVWVSSIEKYESRLTEAEKAARDEISQRQAAISARRPAIIEKKPSDVETWLISQGEKRADLFGMRYIQDLQQPPHALYIGREGEVVEMKNVWSGIIQTARFEQESDVLSCEAYVSSCVLENGESISPAHDDHEAER
jgi:hypothetical protein